MRIALVIRQWIPADVVSERYAERNQGRPPPTPPVESTARTPRPDIVVINPTPVVIRRPAPRFISDPRPTVWRTPRPMPVSIRRPIDVRGNHVRAWHPDPAVIVRIRPIAISIQILRAPDVFVEIPGILSHKLCEMVFALVYPIIKSIG